MSMKKYTVELTNGSRVEYAAQIITYDNIGNLLFANEKQVPMTPENQQGKSLDIVACIHNNQYIQYYPSPTVQ